MIKTKLFGSIDFPSLMRSFSYSYILEHEGDFKIDCLSQYENSVLHFCKSWLQGKKEFLMQSSGSTGEAKEISLSRKIMRNSAKRSLDYFGLKEGMSCFLPLSVEHIAGKMMLVRAMEGELSCTVIQPKIDLINAITDDMSFDFSVMVPMQLISLIDSMIKQDISQHFPLILLGGSALNLSMESRFKKLKNTLYHGYGMTETASHIALRRINGCDSSQNYQVLKNIKIDLNSNNCLKIRDSASDTEWLETTDLAELTGTETFNILGRADDVINSGGIKINPLQLEQKIYTILSECETEMQTGNYYISSIPDKILGERCILVTNNELFCQDDFQSLQSKLKDNPSIDRYSIPKTWFKVPHFPRTNNGKLQRKQLSVMVNEKVETFQ